MRYFFCQKYQPNFGYGSDCIRNSISMYICQYIHTHRGREISRRDACKDDAGTVFLTIYEDNIVACVRTSSVTMNDDEKLWKMTTYLTGWLVD